MDIQENKQFVEQFWETSILPTLQEYIRIPNKSPMFDPDWQKHGHMDNAVQLISDWCQQHAIENMKLEIVRLPGRTPLIFIDIPGSSDDTVLLYGHLDKQPELAGWESDLGPWKPVIKGDKLYGRGGADDGYAVFASLAAIKSVRAQNLPHARCVILIEASEESGSTDLPFYIDALLPRIGQPSLVICLDSGCGNYNQLWVTTSLRGLLGGTLEIKVIKDAVHSGSGSGIVPSCFMILRQLLNRIENEKNGDILLQDLFVDIPEERLHQTKKTADILGKEIYEGLGFLSNTQPVTTDLTQLLLNNTWRPALSITGADGLPKTGGAGNATLPSLKVKLSMRLAPTCDVNHAMMSLKKTLEFNPPFNAEVRFDVIDSGNGWNAPAEKPWLTKASHQASKNYFGADAMYMGEGGSIPFMGMLGKKFPHAQFLITGVLGPHSNAHGPNEFLHIPTGKKLTSCVAELITHHYQR